MYRDVVKVLWCHSHLVFECSIPACACFHSENVFVTCCCCCLFACFILLFFFFLGILREKRGGRGAKGKIHGL